MTDEAPRWEHHHTSSCRNDPELGWACFYSREEKQIFDLQAEADALHDAMGHTWAFALSKIADAAVVAHKQFTPQQVHEWTIQSIQKLADEADALRGKAALFDLVIEALHSDFRDAYYSEWTIEIPNAGHPRQFLKDWVKAYKTAAFIPQPHQPECEHNFQPMYSNWDFQRCVKNCGMFMYREMMLKGEPLPQPHPKETT